MNVVAINNRGKSTFSHHHGVVNIVVVKRKNIYFCHDRGVVDVIANKIRSYSLIIIKSFSEKRRGKEKGR